MSVYRLPKNLKISPELKSKLDKDFEGFSAKDMPKDWEAYVQTEYGLDVSSTYAGMPIKNPFGKASGQLSLNTAQARTDGEAGLGFVILKTVIAQDETGAQMMQDWAIKETKMLVEEIEGHGEKGFTVTWKGRGWYDTFDAYLKFMKEALDLGSTHKMLIVPSVKYHLPTSEDFKVSEYQYTTRALQKVWTAKHPELAMPLEKDFSPTLAGSDRSKQKDTILRWLTTVAKLVKESASKPDDVRIGLKMMNAMFEDEFQLEMLRKVLGASVKPDFLILFNRLFNPKKEFDGKVGVAYGGPDLSTRNLKMLDAWLAENSGKPPIEFSSTGNICSGRMMVEYALRGATSGQLHTYFQLPNPQYTKKEGSKTAKALHQLIFHPEDGLIASLLHLREAQGITKFKDLAQSTVSTT
jgi:dihydroorotate dehydrogenase